MQSSNEITNLLKTNWENIKKQIRVESGITDISYRTWIDPLTIYKVESNTVFILIPQDNPVALQYISKNYLDFFKVTISEFLEEMVEISFTLNKDIINNEETDKNVSENNDQTHFTNGINNDHSNLNPKYRFDTFVVEATTSLLIQLHWLLLNHREYHTILYSYMADRDLEKLTLCIQLVIL